MTRKPDDVIFSATAGCVMLATGAAVMLIVYEAITLFALLPASPVQDLVRQGF